MREAAAAFAELVVAEDSDLVDEKCSILNLTIFNNAKDSRLSLKDNSFVCQQQVFTMSSVPIMLLTLKYFRTLKYSKYRSLNR
jgi:hypothetical protein